MFNLPPLPRTVAACEADLSNEDVNVRRAVVGDLARLPDEAERPQRVALLARALADESSDVRKQALLALADLGPPSDVRAIMPLLSDVEIKVRQIAVLALGELADSGNVEVVGRLASLLGAGDASIRYQALLARSQLVPADSLGDIEIGLDDADAEVRELAVRLTDEVVLGQEQAIPEPLKQRVLRACQDTAPHVRLVAQLLAASQDWEAPRELLLEVTARRFKVREPRDEQEAIRLCGVLGLRKALSSLTRRAYGVIGISFDPFRWVALGALARMGEAEAIRRLIRATKSRRAAERHFAVQELGNSAQPEVAQWLEPLSGKESLVDQEILAVALQNLRDANSAGSAKTPGK